jgi:radical SAM superfamily enzyme YgiQ (UPF0313 family)
MRITFISPFPDVYSFGIRSLSATARAAGHETNLLFVTQEFTQAYSNRVIDQVVDHCKGSNLVGLSLMSNFWDNSAALTHAVRKRLDIPVIWGGIHPTVRPEECLEVADYAAVGESEESFLNLLNHFGQGKVIPGIRARGRKEFERAAPPDCLDSLPSPDIDIGHHFVLEGENLVPMTPEILRKRTGGIYLTIPSRGCPFDCIYCCNVFLNKEFPENKKVRHKSMPRLVDELEVAMNRLPVFSQIKFDDDAFFSLPYEEIAAFGKDYKRRIGLPLMVTGVTPSTVRQDKLEALVEAGLVEVRMGIESASESMRKEYKRPQTERKVVQAAAMMNQFKDRLTPYYDLIIDNPWESDESLVETLRFVARLPLPFELILYSLTFYPGTDVYDRAVAEGLVKDDIEDVYRKYYHSFRPTYLNELFEVLTHYAHWEERIPVRMFDFATHPKVRDNPVFRFLPGAMKTWLKVMLKLRQFSEPANRPQPKPDAHPDLSPQTT